MSRYAIYDKDSRSYVTKDHGADDVFDAQLHKTSEDAVRWFNKFELNPKRYTVVEILTVKQEVALYFDDESKTYKALEAY